MYEKSNVHELAMKNGDAAFRDLEIEHRRLQVRIVELEREVANHRKKFPMLPERASQIVSLQ